MICLYDDGMQVQFSSLDRLQNVRNSWKCVSASCSSRIISKYVHALGRLLIKKACTDTLFSVQLFNRRHLWTFLVYEWILYIQIQIYKHKWTNTCIEIYMYFMQNILAEQEVRLRIKYDKLRGIRCRIIKRSLLTALFFSQPYTLLRPHCCRCINKIPYVFTEATI